MYKTSAISREIIDDYDLPKTVKNSKTNGGDLRYRSCVEAQSAKLHQKNSMSKQFCFLLCVETPSCQTFIIISSTSRKHQMPRYSATSTVSGQLPSAPWDICIYSPTWITLFSLHLFEMTRQLPSSTLYSSGPECWLTGIQISWGLKWVTLFLPFWSCLWDTVNIFGLSFALVVVDLCQNMVKNLNYSGGIVLVDSSGSQQGKRK